MIKNIYVYGLKFVANCALVFAYVSITQCSMGAIYQIPVDTILKQKILISARISRTVD